jgi:hypothetical protein
VDHWRLLLVDDHALFREGLAGLFAYQDDFLIVAEASDADGALGRPAITEATANAYAETKTQRSGCESAPPAPDASLDRK